MTLPVAYLLGLPMPANVEGGVVYEALEDPNWPLTALARLEPEATPGDAT